jgi:hypothetical protein
MKSVRVFLNRLVSLIRSRQAERDIADEIASHLSDSYGERQKKERRVAPYSKSPARSGGLL